MQNRTYSNAILLGKSCRQLVLLCFVSFASLLIAAGCTDGTSPAAPRPATLRPSLVTAAATFYDWDTPPVSATAYYSTIPYEFGDPIQGIKSGYSGGLYGVEVTGDGVRDGTLSANVELVSEVETLGGGQYRYTWTLSNLGSGAVTEFIGGGGPSFDISALSPLLGTAGPDRLIGTADDLAAGQSASSSLVAGPPGSVAWGVIGNPSTGMSALMYAPLETQGPVTTAVTSAPDPALAGAAITVTALVDDGATGGNLIVGAEYRLDGGAYTPMQAQDAAFDEVAEGVTATISGVATAGVYQVCVRGSDAQNNTGAEQCRSLVVYDPAAGFVTGGGWFTSAAGSYAADPTLSGRATVTLVAKYQPSATLPTGNTQLQLKMVGLTFNSISYEWLVVAGARAEYEGIGTINGAGDYGFLLTAVDTDLLAGGGPDQIRLKIWDRANGGVVVYDTQPGATDASNPSTPLGGGSIVIHTP